MRLKQTDEAWIPAKPAECVPSPTLITPLHFTLTAISSSSLAMAAMYIARQSDAKLILAGIFSLSVTGLIASLIGRHITKRIENAIDPIVQTAQTLSIPDEGGKGEAPTRNVPSRFADKINWLKDHLDYLDRAFRVLGMERVQSRTLLARERDRQTQFFASISHELRTPLNAILGYSSILVEEAKGRENEASLADLNHIQIAGHNLLAMIDGLLDVSGFDQVPHSAENSLIDLNALARDIVAQLRGTTTTPVKVSISDDAKDAGKVISDRSKLQACIRNLVSHAIARARGAKVELALKLNPEDPQSVLLTITDDGPPPDVRELAALLEETFRSHSTDEPLDSSVETEIAVARSLVRSLDGELIFAPGAGRGLVRTLVLKKNAAQSRTYAVQTKLPDDKRQKSVPVTEGEQKKVALVIDDDPAATDLLSRWLSRFGYLAVTASNAEDGLSLARTKKPDIILLDALMPGRSGYDVLPDLRAQTYGNDTPIVLVTVDDDRARGLDAGASDYVRKPLHAAELRALVSAYDKDMQGDVLVMEEDIDSAELLCRNLRRLGFTPHHAKNGRDGWAIMQEINPCAILLDLNMPFLDGFEFIDRVTDQMQGKTIPILVFSGQKLSLAEHNRLQEAGCHFFLKGSTSPREVVMTLRKLAV